MQISLLVEGGNMQPGPALSQKLGPTGINMGQVIQKVNDATKEFKGMKVPVEVIVDIPKKDIEVEVFSPPVSELVKKELGIEKGSGEQKTNKVGNASIEQIISVSKTKLPNLISKDLKAAVKEVIGSCVSLGILVENEPAKEVIEEIEQGKYDKEINEEKTETSEEKKKELAEYLSRFQEEQEKKKIAAEKAAEEAEAAKVAEEESKESKEAEEKPGEKEEKPDEKSVKPKPEEPQKK